MTILQRIFYGSFYPLVWCPGGGGSCQVPCVSTSAARLPDPDAAAAEAGESEAERAQDWEESYLAELRGEREQLAGTCGNNSHTLRLLDTGGGRQSKNICPLNKHYLHRADPRGGGGRAGAARRAGGLPGHLQRAPHQAHGQGPRPRQGTPQGEPRPATSHIPPLN